MATTSVNNKKRVTVKQIESWNWNTTVRTKTIKIQLHSAYFVIDRSTPQIPKAFYLLISHENHLSGEIVVRGNKSFADFKNKVNKYKKNLLP